MHDLLHCSWDMYTSRFPSSQGINWWWLLYQRYVQLNIKRDPFGGGGGGGDNFVLISLFLYDQAHQLEQELLRTRQELLRYQVHAENLSQTGISPEVAGPQLMSTAVIYCDPRGCWSTVDVNCSHLL